MKWSTQSLGGQTHRASLVTLWRPRMNYVDI